jgi:3-deoxy-manno-octulosonate cytidylyltransferase (CMP-KDO synthetase)
LTFSVFIPARYQSERFPGKPLIDLNGKSMIQRVYERATLSDATSVYVATDDDRIAAEVERFGGQVIMTLPSHPSGTDRVFEAVRQAGLAENEVVVNVQGDEPLIPPSAINLVAKSVVQVPAGPDNTKVPSVGMATLKEEITSIEEVLDPNIVKVVTDQDGMALYFSRAPIPFSRTDFSHGQGSSGLPGQYRWYRHLGIYAYRVSLLQRFVNWPPAELELVEHLEQLRVLANGERIYVGESPESVPPGIDVPADVAKTLEFLDD